MNRSDKKYGVYKSMDTLKALFQKYRQFLAFCVVGALNTLVAFLVYTALAFFSGVDSKSTLLLLFNVIGDIAGGINSYLCNRFWVFRKNEATTRDSLPKFIVTFCVYLGISTGLFKLCQWLLPINKYLIKIIVLPITTVINYLMNKFWAFKGSSRKDS